MVLIVHAFAGIKAKATLVLGDDMLTDGDDWDYVPGVGLRWRDDHMLGDGIAMRLEATMGLMPDGRLRADFVQKYDSLPAERFPAVALLDRCVASSN